MTSKIILTFLILWSVQSQASICENLLQWNFVESFKSQWDQQKDLFSKNQVKRWSEALEHLWEDLDQVRESSSAKDQKIKGSLESAVANLPDLKAAYQKLSQEKVSKAYYSELMQAVWATLSLHSHELLESKSSHQDYPRFFKILKEIQDFDSSNPEFSFYKIKRALRGRFAVKEYIRCK